MSLRRVPIKGWAKCVHDAASFEGRGEYAAALLLDSASMVGWWLRNDPVSFRIPTPAGYFEPDFIYHATRSGTTSMGILEIKGESFWDGDGSVPRVKAAAASEWARAVHEVGVKPPWEFAVVLEQDALRSTTFEELRGFAVQAFP